MEGSGMREAKTRYMIIILTTSYSVLIEQGANVDTPKVRVNGRIRDERSKN